MMHAELRHTLEQVLKKKKKKEKRGGRDTGYLG